MQDGRFAPVAGESVDGADFREPFGDVVFGDYAEDERCLVFDAFGSAVWEVHGAVSRAEGSAPVVNVLQDVSVDLFDVIEIEIAWDTLRFEFQDALVGGRALDYCGSHGPTAIRPIRDPSTSGFAHPIV